MEFIEILLTKLYRGILFFGEAKMVGHNFVI